MAESRFLRVYTRNDDLRLARTFTPADHLIRWTVDFELTNMPPSTDFKVTFVAKHTRQEQRFWGPGDDPEMDHVFTPTLVRSGYARGLSSGVHTMRYTIGGPAGGNPKEKVDEYGTEFPLDSWRTLIQGGAVAAISPRPNTIVPFSYPLTMFRWPGVWQLNCQIEATGPNIDGELRELWLYSTEPAYYLITYDV